MDLGLKNKSIMVEARSRGLGYGISRAVALEGARVSIASTTNKRIHEAGNKLRVETGAEVISTVFDPRDGDSITAWQAQTVSRFGTVDGLVVNAGGHGRKPSAFRSINFG